VKLDARQDEGQASFQDESRRKNPAAQLVEKEHFAKLNKFAGKKEFSQKSSPCANLFLNQRGRGTLTVPSHTLPPSEGVGSYVYRQTEPPEKSGGFHCYTAF
jgi:hypothetical protein